MKKLLTRKILAIDTETTGLSAFEGCRPWCVSFCDRSLDPEVETFSVDPSSRVVTYDDATREKVHRRLADPQVDKIFFNAKFDLEMLYAAGFEVPGRIECASIAVRVAGLPRRLWRLKPLASELFAWSTEDEEKLKAATSLLRIRAKRLGWAIHPTDVPPDYWLVEYAEEIMVESEKTMKSFTGASPNRQKKLLDAARAQGREMTSFGREYAGGDAGRTVVTWLHLENELRDSGQYAVYREEVDSIMPIVMSMRRHGVRTIRANVRAGAERALKMIDDEAKKVVRLLGPDFNTNSYPQKKKYFIDKLGLEPLEHTPAGNPKLDKSFFRHYVDASPAIAAIVAKEKATKANSTYFDWFDRAADRNDDWVVRDDIAQWGTVSGRFTGRLLTVPKRAPRDDIMMVVRSCLGPRPGCVWCLGDYQQIEARIFADEFGEETMLEAFAAGRDVYQELNDAIVTRAGVDPGRQVSKGIFLGKLYGMGVEKLRLTIARARGEDVSTDEAREIVDAFDHAMPGVREAMDETIARVERDGYVENRYRQRLYLHEDKAYKGVNFIIQPTAQRLMKRAMIKCHNYLRESGCGAIVLQVHDELVFELRDSPGWSEHTAVLKTLMEDNDGAFTRVATPVDFSRTRTNWLEKKEWNPHEENRVLKARVRVHPSDAR